MSSFSYQSTFLRSALARDPFSLGDLGPEEYLQIEADYPNLFESYSNDPFDTCDAIDGSGEQLKSTSSIKKPPIASNSGPSCGPQPVRNPYRKPEIGRILPANANKCDGSCSRTIPTRPASFTKPNTTPTRRNIATRSATTFRPIQVPQRPGSLSKTVSRPPDCRQHYQSPSNQSQLVSINDLRKLLDEDFFTKFQAMAAAAQNVNPSSSSNLIPKGSPQPSRVGSAIKIKEFFQDEVNLDLIKKEIVAQARKKYHGRIPYSGVNPMSERWVRKPPQINIQLDQKSDNKSEEEKEINLKAKRSLSSLPAGPGFIRPTILKKVGQKSKKTSSPLKKSVKFIKETPVAAAAMNKPSLESMHVLAKKPERSEETSRTRWTVLDESIEKEDSDSESELSTTVSLTQQINLKGTKREELKCSSGRESSKYSESMTSYRQLKLARSLASTYEKLGLLKLKHCEEETTKSEVSKFHTKILISDSESSSFHKDMEKRTKRSVTKYPTDSLQEKLPTSKPSNSPQKMSNSQSSKERVPVPSSSRSRHKKAEDRPSKPSPSSKYTTGNSYPVLEKIAKELVYKEVLRHLSEVQAKEQDEIRKAQELEDEVLKSEAEKLAKSVQETRSQSPSSGSVILTPELTQSNSQADNEIKKPSKSLSEVQIDLDFKPVTPQLTVSMCKLATDKQDILKGEVSKSKAEKLAKNVQKTRSPSPSSGPVILTPELTQSNSQADNKMKKPSKSLSEVQIDLDFKPVTPQLTLSMCIEQLTVDKEGILELEEMDVNLDNTDCTELSDFIVSVSDFWEGQDLQPSAVDGVGQDLEPSAGESSSQDKQPSAVDVVIQDLEPSAVDVIGHDLEPSVVDVVGHDLEPSAVDVVGQDLQPSAGEFSGQDLQPSAGEFLGQDWQLSVGELSSQDLETSAGEFSGRDSQSSTVDVVGQDLQRSEGEFLGQDFQRSEGEFLGQDFQLSVGEFLG